MLLLSKICLVPIIIALISLAGRVWGPRVSGMLGGLPVIAGPIVVFLTLDNGTHFGVLSSHAALSGVISLAFFCYAYAYFARYNGVFTSMLAGLSAFFVLTFIGLQLEIKLILFFPIVLTVLTVQLFKFPSFFHTKAVASIPSLEIVYRMFASATLVLALTLSATFLGPTLSGLLAPFPIAGTILAGFTHYGSGANAAICLLYGFMQGLFGMASFFFVFAILLPYLEIPASLVVAILATLLVSKLTNFFSSKRNQKIDGFEQLMKEESVSTI